MAQRPDRWAAKILALPVFSDAFAQALQLSPYANLAFVAAMEARSASGFHREGVRVGLAVGCLGQGWAAE